MTRRVVLLRHGRTAWNAERRFQGQADPPLDEVGRGQAYEAAALISALHPALIVTSDLQRARQTADPLGAITGIPVITDERLRERHLGHWQGLTREDVEVRYPDEFADWRAGRDVSRRGGESRQQVAARAVEAFDSLDPAAGLTVIVTHSATAMALSNALLGLPQGVHVLDPLANCHWSELRRDEDQWRLRAHNVGAPGPVIPVATVFDPASDEASDADA